MNISAICNYLPQRTLFVRVFYGLVAAMLLYTLVAQCLLTHSEHRSLANTFSYFTIQSNVLVLVSSAVLAYRPHVTGTAWRLLRLAALVGITTTGLVYICFLAPYVHLSGIALVYNAVFHYITPVVSVLGFLLVEPKHGFRWKDYWFLAWPVLWLAYTMVRGAYFHPDFNVFSEKPSHYPYGFLDVNAHPLSSVLAAIVLVLAIIVAIAALVILYDRRVKKLDDSKA